jgi:hypothetical protein
MIPLELINGKIRYIFEDGHNKDLGCLSFAAYCGCPSCAKNMAIREYMFKEFYVSDYDYGIHQYIENNKEKLTLDWNIHVYPKLSNMTLLQLYNIIYQIKIKLNTQHFEILHDIDYEIKNFIFRELAKITNQLNDMGEKQNLIIDWLTMQKKNNNQLIQ